MQTRLSPRLARALVLGIGLASVGPLASAELVYGTLSNFDVYNDTGGPTYGFEIEFDDLSTDRIAFTFGNPHYGSGTRSQNGTTAVLRYAATFDALSASWSIFTAQHAPGGAVATTGHACVFAVGCEHFGAVLYGNPTATRFHWLIEDVLNPGNLVDGPAVSLMAPIHVVVPPANPGGQFEVRAEFEAPEFEHDPEFEVEQQYPDAVWARITKIELGAAVDLDDLRSDNALLFDNEDLVVEEEVEWDLIEKGAEPFELRDRPGDDVRQIVRRIETYRYIGPVTDENEPDCDAIDCDNPLAGVTLGDLIGANMVGFNVEPIELQVAPVPLPAGLWLLGPALAVLGRRRGRRG
jgi:hypothetical protein